MWLAPRVVGGVGACRELGDGDHTDVVLIRCQRLCVDLVDIDDNAGVQQVIQPPPSRVGVGLSSLGQGTPLVHWPIYSRVVTEVRVLGAQQARSRRTQRLIMDAGFEILEHDGADALTIAAVSKHAGVAAGTVYRRFGDKEGLLRELEEEFTRGVIDDIRDRMRSRELTPEATPAEAVDIAVRAIVDTVRATERLLRVFAVLGLRELQVMEIGSRASQEGARVFRDALWPFRGSFNRTDVERALDVAHRLVYSGCLHRVLNGPNLESAAELTWDEAADELVRATQLMLLGRL